MSRKSKLKLEIKKAIKKHYLDGGYTNTGYAVLQDLMKAINKVK